LNHYPYTLDHIMAQTLREMLMPVAAALAAGNRELAIKRLRGVIGDDWTNHLLTRNSQIKDIFALARRVKQNILFPNIFPNRTERWCHCLEQALRTARHRHGDLANAVARKLPSSHCAFDQMQIVGRSPTKATLYKVVGEKLGRQPNADPFIVEMDARSIVDEVWNELKPTFDDVFYG
jgi:hypothetical protein